MMDRTDAVDPLAEALDDVKELVLDTAAGLGVELPWADQEDTGAVTPCMDASGSPSGRVYTHYGIEATPAEPPDWEEVLVRAAKGWGEKGFDVRRRDYDESYSAVFASANGYDAKVAVNRSEGRLVIGASSPCLPVDEA